MNPENTDAYIYLATAIILSMLTSLTGIGAVILVCTIPALLNAKNVCTVKLSYHIYICSIHLFGFLYIIMYIL